MLSFQRLCAVASRAPSIGPLAVRRGGVAAARLLGTGGSEGERKIAALLREKLDPTHLEVQDISGGCGSMYMIAIDSQLFRGKRILQQHQMVNQALGEELVKSLHGLTIRTGPGTNS